MSATDCSCCGRPNGECLCWEFPGWGKVERITDLQAGTTAKPKKQLGQWRATGICGNDITSSCLYVSALAAIYAGPLAPIALLLVAGVLYLFRGIYAEVGSALPFNGGAYNLLLNTSTKWRAAMAACLTILSYIATAVISGSEAMHYAAEFLPSLNIMWATVTLLILFALLNFMGITESATVALLIFAFHICTLVALVVLALIVLIHSPHIFVANLQTPMDQWPMPRSGGFLVALFFGFSAAMLGISGFESSANYIEEQKPGVFPKTLRNMWIAVAVFNPLISLLTFAVFPMDHIAVHKEALLSNMGHHGIVQITGANAQDSLPRFVSHWISFDAVIVLSGAVLTSFVGVSGLIRRMSLDDCLPRFFLRTNRWRGTNHWIIAAFLLLCISILSITKGSIEMLAGVYTLSFLSVMGLFAGGNLLLKRKHPNLHRTTKANVKAVFAALVAVIIALVGNILLDPDYVRVFGIYFASSIAIVGFVFYRAALIKLVLKMLYACFSWPLLRRYNLRSWFVSILHDLECRRVLFIVSNGDSIELHKAVEYVRCNEQIRFMKIAWFYDQESELPVDLERLHSRLDHEVPQVHIDFVLVQSALNSGSIQSIARQLDVPNNYVFVTSKSAADIDELVDLGGARIVF